MKIHEKATTSTDLRRHFIFKQAPRASHERLSSFLIEKGYLKVRLMLPCLYDKSNCQCSKLKYHCHASLQELHSHISLALNFTLDIEFSSLRLYNLVLDGLCFHNSDKLFLHEVSVCFSLWTLIYHGTDSILVDRFYLCLQYLRQYLKIHPTFLCKYPH